MDVIDNFRHKSGSREVVVRKIGATHLEVATNLNGRLVVERHPRPA